MSTKINDGGPAFPVEVQTYEGMKRGLQTSSHSEWETGMSLRDWFATHADVPWNAVLETLRLRGNPHPTISEMTAYRAELKYAEADAMLAARKAGA